MAVAYPFGPFYFQKIRLEPGSPIVHTAPTHELDEPFRFGRCAIFQYWPGHALAIGRWRGKHASEDSALMAGMDAREDELVDDDGKLLDRYKIREDARKTVAKNSTSLAEEWEIINMLDLLEDGSVETVCEDEDDCSCDTDGCSIHDDDQPISGLEILNVYNDEEER